MRSDVADLRDFYATQLGHVVRHLVGQRIRARWRRLEGGTLMGLGFAAPYLTAFRGEARVIGALMPAQQGALVWPSLGPTQSLLVESERLPLADNAVDRLIVVHGLELAERERPLLREIWRVLAPEGHLLLIVPNRRGVWARMDNTPFGQGRPYSRGQLEKLLHQALLTPIHWSQALHVPPIDRRLVVRSALAFERLGTRLSPAFGGVIIVEARKEVAAMLGDGHAARVITAGQAVPV